jgi:hypothetical protein
VRERERRKGGRERTRRKEEDGKVTGSAKGTI